MPTSNPGQWQDDVRQALAAFGTDERYAVTMAFRARKIIRIRAELARRLRDPIEPVVPAPSPAGAPRGRA